MGLFLWVCFFWVVFLVFHFVFDFWFSVLSLIFGFGVFLGFRFLGQGAGSTLYISSLSAREIM